MGNKLCKRKTDVVDAASPKNQTPFDRIITRLHLRPTSWKSDSYLNQKQVNRHEISKKSPSESSNKITTSQNLSKSSDWTDVSLEVPDKEEHIHLKNPKLSIIFNNENGTPTPPPRKHKKNFREKLEAVAKNGLQAFQPNKNKPEQPVEEPLFTKKKINYNCPICDSDEKNHNRDHHHHTHTNPVPSPKNNQANSGGSGNVDKASNDDKRKKNLSVISLPNYNELKLTVVNFEDIDKNNKHSDGSFRKNNKKANTPASGKLDGISRRCRSFGSLFPQQLKKLKLKKTPADIESDDSFGALEDWDLGLIEHYNPKDASLPRIRNRLHPKNDQEVLSGIEDLIVKEEDLPQKPVPPVRQSESLLKKINKTASQTAHQQKSTSEGARVENNNTLQVSNVNATPPPSPELKNKQLSDLSEEEIPFIDSLATEEDGKVEHSSLMRILQEFSMKDTKEKKKNEEKIVESKYSSNQSSLTPSLLEFEKNLNINSIEEFINVEKSNNSDINIVRKRTIIG